MACPALKSDSELTQAEMQHWLRYNFQLQASAQAICELLKATTTLSDRTSLLHATV